MLLAYLPLLLFDSFARMAIATVQMMPISGAPAILSGGEPTIILME
ncbi:hypothetical protein ACVWWO_005372 [Bradyrhizobium sp. F1.13.1]